MSAATARRGAASRSSARAGCPRPRTCASSAPTPGCPAASARPASPPGIKPSGRPDLGLLVCDAEQPVSAARFTASGTAAAPVLLNRERCRLDALRAVLANSGCANAATGRRGLEDAAKTQGAARRRDRRRAGRGRARLDRRHQPVPAPSTRCCKGSSPRAAGSRRRRRRATSSRRSRRPTRSRSARTSRSSCPPGTVRLNAQCKGAGMISPRFATMLCFVETDAALAPETADLLLGVCVKRSFDRASVDGQLSTNDTALLLCSGASGVARRARERGRAALRRGARRAAAPARGHDGRRRRGRRRGSRAWSCAAGNEDGVEAAARAVANSPLVKAALHGGDPNWGRIVQAVGGALPDTAPLPVDVSIEGIAGLLGRRRDRLRRGRARRGGAARRRSSTRSACRARAPRPRCSSRTSRRST